MKQRLDQLKKLSITARLSLFVAALLVFTIGITVNNALSRQEKITNAATNNLSRNSDSSVRSSPTPLLTGVPTETNCTDGIDNDRDGLIDNADGDCWIRNTAIYETHPFYYPNHSFKEVTADIPRIAGLGVKTIYLLPIWKHEPLPPEGSQYRYGMIYHILDYYSISPEFGTEQELKEIVDVAHRYDIRVIFDLVTCCAFKDSVPYKNDLVLKISLSELKTKKIPLSYKTIDGINYVYSNCDINEKENLKSKCDLLGRIDNNNVKLFTYPAPGYGFAIDKTNPQAIDYFTNVAKYYVKEYGIDGWRIDAPMNVWNPDIIEGDHSALPLLRKAKKAISEIKPEAIFLSEHSSLNPLAENPDQSFDEIAEVSYGTDLYNQLPFLISKGSSGDLINALNDEKITFNRSRLRFTENHDNPRVNTIPNISKPSLVLVSTIPGILMIQSGQEIGATGKFTSAAPINWLLGDKEMEKFYKKILNIRNTSNSLKYGNIKNVWKGGGNSYAYSRTYENETVIVLINFNGSQATSYLNLPFKSRTILKDELSGETFVVNDPANFRIFIPAFGSRILTSNAPTPAPRSNTMHFGAQVTFASADMLIGIAELKEQLKVIEETGADVIRIDMDYEAWMKNNQDNIRRHDELIKQIKADGKLLMLADRGAISFKKNKVTWDYFREQHLKYTKIFAEKYKPNYYVVVKEPIWYYKFYAMISTETTPEMWRDLASEACTIVKAASPSTKCAVAVYASGERESDFFALAAKIQNLDIMGVDVYDDKGIQATTNTLISLVPQDKELWMLESWNGGGGSFLQPWKERADAEWITKSVHYSRDNNFMGYISYYPIHFSSYTKLSGVDWSVRKLPFYSYKSVIEEVSSSAQ